MSRPKSGSQYSRTKKLIEGEKSLTTLPMSMASNALSLDINRVNIFKA